MKEFKSQCQIIGWWAVSFAGISLVQNYGTSLFDAVDSKSKFNGHILAASQAVGSIGSYCAVYLEKYATKSGLSIYVLGSALMCILCACMGMSAKIWAAYFFYVTICGIYQTLQCLAAVEFSGLSIFAQFISFAGFFFLSTVIFLGLCFIDDGKIKPTSNSVSASDPEHLLSENS